MRSLTHHHQLAPMIPTSSTRRAKLWVYSSDVHRAYFVTNYGCRVKNDGSIIIFNDFYGNFLTSRDKEQIRVLKSDTENELRESISDLRLKPAVTDAMFHRILDHVGFRSKENEDVLEQLMPVEYLISSFFVETYRREDFESLANGSMEYSTLAQPNYRTCVERAPNLGRLLLLFC